MKFHHIPVLLKETLDYLKPKPGGIYVDGTMGGGGHSEEILKRIHPTGRLIGIDRDPAAIQAASRRLEAWSDCFTAVHGNYVDIRDILTQLSIDAVDGVLLDLGVSSHQLDTPERGFSYHDDVRLDMRMDTTQEFSAYELINQSSLEELSQMIWEYGEERCKAHRSLYRGEPSLETTAQFVEVIKASAAARRGGPHRHGEPFGAPHSGQSGASLLNRQSAMRQRL